MITKFVALTEAARRAGRSPRFIAARAALHGAPLVAVEVGGGRVLTALAAASVEALAAELAAESQRLGLPNVTTPAVQ